MTHAALQLLCPNGLVFALAAGLLSGGSAHAQNALGGGGALDANLGVGTGRVNAPRTVEDYRARNLIVTGNVAGGRGFRGTVGYGAETDFRGVTGVDDLFGFRADSALSAPAIATSPGLQQLRFGRDIGVLSFRRGEGAAAPGVMRGIPDVERSDDFRTQRPIDMRVRIDEITAGAAAATRVEVPPVGREIGAALGEGDRLHLIEVSPLRGITATTPEQRAAQLGLTPYDIARMQAERTRMPGAEPEFPRPTYEPDFSALASQRVLPDSPQTRVMTGTDEQMTAILRRIADRYVGRTDAIVQVDTRVLDRLDEEYQELREELARLSPGQRWRLEAELAAEEERARMQEELDEDAEPTAPVPGAAPGEVELPAVAIERLFEALRHGERVDRLAPEGNTRFDELMADAEQSLRAGEYFDAERRFMRALRFSPGHPLAMVGSAHAQLGAGLQLPAALSIRRVLTRYPELIDARYGAELLPSRPRLSQLVSSIETRLAVRTQDQADYGLVLAYIGHHMEDRELIERGLGLMDEAVPDDRLAQTLRGIWLAAPQPPVPSEPEK